MCRGVRPCFRQNSKVSILKVLLLPQRSREFIRSANWCLVFTNASFRYFLRSRVTKCFLHDQWWPFKLISYMSTKNTVPKTIKQCAPWFLNDCWSHIKSLIWEAGETVQLVRCLLCTHLKAWHESCTFVTPALERQRKEDPQDELTSQPSQ